MSAQIYSRYSPLELPTWEKMPGPGATVSSQPINQCVQPSAVTRWKGWWCTQMPSKLWAWPAISPPATSPSFHICHPKTRHEFHIPTAFFNFFTASFALSTTTTLVSPLNLCKKPSPKNLPTRHHFSSVQSCPALRDLMDYSTPGFTVHHQLPEWTQTHVLWVGDAIQPSHPLSSPSPTSIFSSIRVFSSQSVLRIRWPKHWIFSISPSNE